MNAFRTISRVLVVTAVVFVGTTSAMNAKDKDVKGKSRELAQLQSMMVKVGIPLLAKEALANQSSYVSAVGQAAVATMVNGHMPLTMDQLQTEGLTAAQYFAVNTSSRTLAAAVAANTRLNKKYFDDTCDDYIGAVPYVGQPVSETIKKVMPSVIETAHNSIAASIKNRQASIEVSFTF